MRFPSSKSRATSDLGWAASYLADQVIRDAERRALFLGEVFGKLGDADFRTWTVHSQHPTSRQVGGRRGAYIEGQSCVASPLTRQP